MSLFFQLLHTPPDESLNKKHENVLMDNRKSKKEYFSSKITNKNEV